MAAEALCIIPARGGSKGIPHKNIVEVCGKPLIAYTIEQAFCVPEIGKVIVSTDDDAIADVASAYGAEVFRRSYETATDYASSEFALLETLATLAYLEELSPVTVFLQATSPIRQLGDIDRCIELASSHCDSVFSCRRIEGYTWSRSGRLWPNYTVREPRQDRSLDMLEENGSIYAFRTAGFLREKVRLFGMIEAYEMHPLDSFQIDEASDVALFELLIPLRLGNDSAVEQIR